MNRGDIILALIPFSDATRQGVRPALVVSNDKHNATAPDVVCVMISSRIEKARHEDYVLHKSNPDFAATGLARPSVVRIDRIHALDKGITKRRLGRASPKILTEVGHRLADLLDLR